MYNNYCRDVGTFFLGQYSLQSILVAARLAQLVEHQTFNLRVKGSSPLSGELFFLFSI